MIITSNSNKLIKHIKSLYDKSKRDKYKEFFIEGYKLIKDAMENNMKFNYVIVETSQKSNFSELLEDCEKLKIQVYEVTLNIFNEISDTQTPQGILAVCYMLEYNINDLIKMSYMVLLENIQDPGNMGTIIRTADATGVNAIMVSKGSVDIYNPKVLRSAMGSIFHIPIIYCEDFCELIDNLNKNKFTIYAAHLNGKKFYYDVNMKEKIAIIIGNEGRGISNEVTQKCNLIKVPMIGKCESLNAAVCAGIIMYECVRQRLGR